MKKINLSQTCLAWLAQKGLFFFILSALVSVSLAVATVIFFPFYWGIFLTVFIMSLIVWLKLYVLSSKPFGNHFWAIGWALIVFCLSFQLATVSVTTDEYGIKCEALPILWAGLLSSLIYSIAPEISYFLGLDDDKLGNDKEGGFNNPLWILVLYAVFSFSFAVSETLDRDKIKEEIVWTQTPFEPVLSWQTEIWDHIGTVYLVTTKKGTFVVYPRSTPEIRRISTNTKIRVLFCPDYCDESGAKTVKRMEIQNENSPH